LPSPSQQWFQSSELPASSSPPGSSDRRRMATPTPSVYDWEVGSGAMRPPRAVRIVIIALGAGLLVVGGWMFWPRRPVQPEPASAPAVAQSPARARPIDAGAPGELAPLSAALAVDAAAPPRIAERVSQGTVVRDLSARETRREPP